MYRVERECGPSGCRALGLTPELSVHVVLVPPLLVPPLLVPQLLVPSLLVPPLLVPPLLVPSLLVPPLLRFQALVPMVTSTASRLLFSGLPSEVSSSPAVVVTKKAPDFTRAGHRIVQSRLLLSFFAAPEAYASANIYPTDTSQ